MLGSDEVRCSFCGAVNRKGRPNCYKCGAWGLAGPLPAYSSYSVEKQNLTASIDDSSARGPTLKTEPFAFSIESSRLDPPKPIQPVQAGWVPPRPVTDSDFSNPWSDKQASDTSRGLLLLAVGLILSIIPVINIIGIIISIIGAVYVIIGRDGFGEKHSRNVIVGAIVYSIAVLVTVAVGFSLLSDVQSAFSSSTDATAISSAVGTVVSNYMIVFFTLGTITGLAVLLFTYAIQDRTGKILLWSAFVTTLGIGMLGISLLNQLPAATSQALSTHDPSPLYSFVSLVQGLSYLRIIPAIITAIAYLNARSRVDTGQLDSELVATATATSISAA